MKKKRVLMIPSLAHFKGVESGIKRVIEKYYTLSDMIGVEFVECDVKNEEAYDLFCVHAGTSAIYPSNKPIVAIIHGLYWTADYQASNYEWRANQNVIESIRRATIVTVPSNWVAETIRRDARIDPVVLPHGINWKDWQHNRRNLGYVLWNKNRVGDVCNPEAVRVLSSSFPEIDFITTFSPVGYDVPNVQVIGVISHSDMKRLVQQAGVYLSTTKETFGIGILEALASGTPVLGFAHGGNLDLVQHGVNGYLANPGNWEDLKTGLLYCIKYRDVLSTNARELAKYWGWEKPARILKSVFEMALSIWEDQQRKMFIPSEQYLV